jgi:hypothetical protein
MNPFNLIINYLIADSRSKHYNVTDTQKVKSTAILMGAFSQNPIVDYLVIDNQAKNLQQTGTSEIVVTTPSPSETGQTSTPVDSNSNSSTGSTTTTNTKDSEIKELAKKVDDIISLNKETQKQIKINNDNLLQSVSDLKGVAANNSKEIQRIWDNIKKNSSVIEGASKPITSSESATVSEKNIHPKTK